MSALRQVPAVLALHRDVLPDVEYWVADDEQHATVLCQYPEHWIAKIRLRITETLPTAWYVTRRLPVPDRSDRRTSPLLVIEEIERAEPSGAFEAATLTFIAESLRVAAREWPGRSFTNEVVARYDIAALVRLSEDGYDVIANTEA